MTWPKLCRVHPPAAPDIHCYPCALDLWGQDFEMRFEDPIYYTGFLGYFPKKTEQPAPPDRSSGDVG